MPVIFFSSLSDSVVMECGIYQYTNLRSFSYSSSIKEELTSRQRFDGCKRRFSFFFSGQWLRWIYTTLERNRYILLALFFLNLRTVETRFQIPFLVEEGGREKRSNFSGRNLSIGGDSSSSVLLLVSSYQRHFLFTVSSPSNANMSQFRWLGGGQYE